MAATSELKIVVNAEDNASSKIKGISGSLEDMKPVFAGMAAAGTVAFGAISAVIASSLKESKDAQTAQLQLQHAVMDVTHATQAQLDATSALADTLEAKGVLDGDNIKMGLAQLSTFGLSNKAVQALGGSLADLAVNQFGVNASGEQLSDTANMIAKALNGQFGVLEKSGIRFNAAQQHAIQFGTEMEKVKAINEGFAQNLKYTNEVALQGMEGQMAKLNVQVGNLKQGIGDALLPIITQLLTAVQPIIEQMVAWTQAHPELTKNLLLAALAISGIVAIAGTLGLILPSIIAGFTFLGSTAAIVIGIVAALALVFYNVYQATVLLQTSLPEIIAGIKAYWQDLVGWVTEKVLNPLKKAFEDVWASITSTVHSAMDAVMSYINPIINTVENLLSKIGQVGSYVGSKVSGAFSAVTSAISGTRAAGGPVSDGSSYLVGENGPEIFTPSMSGSITPNGGGGGIVINVTGTFMSETAARDMGDKIIAQFRRAYRM